MKKSFYALVLSVFINITSNVGQTYLTKQTNYYARDYGEKIEKLLSICTDSNVIIVDDNMSYGKDYFDKSMIMSKSENGNELWSTQCSDQTQKFGVNASPNSVIILETPNKINYTSSGKFYVSNPSNEESSFAESYIINEGILNVDPKWKNYTMIDDIGSIAIQSNRYLWIGCQGGGLARYDIVTNEKKFFNRDDGLTHNGIRKILVKNEEVWVITDAGLNKYNGIQWEGYFQRSTWVEPYSRKDYFISGCVDSSGGVWFIGDKIKRYYNNQWETFNLPIMAQITASRNYIYGLKENVIYKYDYTLNTLETITFTLPNDIRKEYTTNFNVDHLGNLWYKTEYTNYDDVIVKVEMPDANVIIFNYINSPLAKYISTIGIDSYNNKWFISDATKIIKYDDFSWTEYDIGLGHRIYPPEMKFDNHGNIWFPSNPPSLLFYENQAIIHFEAKVSKWEDGNISSYYLNNTNAPSQNLYSSIFQNKKDELWVSSSYHGTDIFNGESWDIIIPRADTGPVNSWIYCINEDEDGNMWIGSTGFSVSVGGGGGGYFEGGIAKYDGINWSQFKKSNSSMPYKSIEFIIPDKVGNIWCGGYYSSQIPNYGVVRINNNTIYHYTTSNAPFLSERVDLLLVEDDRTWFRSEDRILWFINNEWEIVNPVILGLPDKNIVDILIGIDNCKWILYEDEIVKWCADTILFINRNNSELPYETLKGFLYDKSGNLYLFADNVYKFDGYSSFIQISKPVPQLYRIIYFLDNDDNLCALIQARGFGIYKDGLWQIYDQGNSLIAGTYFSSFYVDRRNNIYFSFDEDNGWGTGLGQYHEGGIKDFKTPYIYSGINSYYFRLATTEELPKTIKFEISDVSQQGGSWSVSNSSDWISHDLQAVNNYKNILTLSIIRKDLIPGTFYYDTIKVNLNHNTIKDIPIKYQLIEERAYISTSKPELSFEAAQYYTLPKPDTILISNLGLLPMSWEITNSKEWISIRKNGDYLIVEINSTDLEIGTYTDTLWITSEEAVNSPYPINVNYLIRKQIKNPIISVRTLTFNFIKGNINIPSQFIRLNNYGEGEISWFITRKPNSIALSKMNGLCGETTFDTIYINIFNSNITSYIDTLEISFNTDPIITRTVSIKFDVQLPDKIELYQNFPNPFNSNTTIKFSVETATRVTLTIFNNIGERVEIITNEFLEPGLFFINWIPSNLPSGIYYCNLRTDDFTKTVKVVYLK